MGQGYPDTLTPIHSFWPILVGSLAPLQSMWLPEDSAQPVPVPLAPWHSPWRNPGCLGSSQPFWSVWPISSYVSVFWAAAWSYFPLSSELSACSGTFGTHLRIVWTSYAFRLRMFRSSRNRQPIPERAECSGTLRSIPHRPPVLTFDVRTMVFKM